VGTVSPGVCSKPGCQEVWESMRNHHSLTACHAAMMAFNLERPSYGPQTLYDTTKLATLRGRGPTLKAPPSHKSADMDMIPRAFHGL